MQWAKDMLCAMIRAAAFERLPALRLRRSTEKATATGPVLFARTLESNAKADPAAVVGSASSALLARPTGEHP